MYAHLHRQANTTHSSPPISSPLILSAIFFFNLVGHFLFLYYLVGHLLTWLTTSITISAVGVLWVLLNLLCTNTQQLPCRYLWPPVLFVRHFHRQCVTTCHVHPDDVSKHHLCILSSLMLLPMNVPMIAIIQTSLLINTSPLILINSIILSLYISPHPITLHHTTPHYITPHTTDKTGTLTQNLMSVANTWFMGRKHDTKTFSAQNDEVRSLYSLYSSVLLFTLLYSTHSTLLYSSLLYSTLLYSILLYSTLFYCITAPTLTPLNNYTFS